MRLWHDLDVQRRNVDPMFGPLNGVRIALVAAAVVAALAAYLAGYVWAGTVLLVGVSIHGLGWLYLYSKRTGTERPTETLGSHRG